MATEQQQGSPISSLTVSETEEDRHKPTFPHDNRLRFTDATLHFKKTDSSPASPHARASASETSVVDPELPHHTDVIIVGAGPAGLTLSNELARYNVEFVVLDHTRIEYPLEPSPEVEASLPTQGVLLRADTLDLLQESGVINEVVLQGRPVQGAVVLLNGELHHQVQRFTGSEETKFQTGVVLEQWKLERFLCEKLGMTAKKRVFRQHVAYRVVIKCDTSAASNSSANENESEWAGPEDYRVKVFVKKMDPVSRKPSANSDGRWIRAKYLVGADGVRSMTRRALGIQMADLGPPEDYLVADIVVSHWGSPHFGKVQSARGSSMIQMPQFNSVFIVHTDCGSALFFPYSRDDHWRLLVHRPPLCPSDQSDQPFRKLEAPTDQEIMEIVGQVVPGTVVEAVNWRVAYSTAPRLATQMMRERGLLIGDAARLDSPLWSGGLNEALYDAVALGWRLAAVLDYGAPHALLESFDRERCAQSHDSFRLGMTNRDVLLNFEAISTSGREMSKFSDLLKKRMKMSTIDLDSALRAVILAPEAVLHHVSGFDTGDCVGSCRALGFAVNDDAPPRALTLRSLVREGCFAFLMLVRILPLGTKHHTIFGSRYERLLVEKLAALGQEVVHAVGHSFPSNSTSLTQRYGVKPVWVLCGLQDRATVAQGSPLMTFSQLTKQVPSALKAYMHDGQNVVTSERVDFGAPSYSIIDHEYEIQDKSRMILQGPPNWLSDLTTQLCGEKTRSDPTCAFILLRPDGRVGCKGYPRSSEDTGELRAALQRYLQAAR